MIALDVPGFEMSVVPLEIFLVSVLLEQDENLSLAAIILRALVLWGPSASHWVQCWLVTSFLSFPW